jgi:CubicO group peptidase (beta-lactamase class C family)
VLSHTAGLTDGLGYAGFKPGEAIQDLAGSLTRAADASPGADGAVRVGLKPGNTFKYSGGGYTMLQMMIEDVSGMSFNAYMTSHVFDPLGMTRSTFVPEETSSPDVAEFFDSRGAPATHFRFSALAAASLYTTANDMTRFLQAHVAGSQGELPGRGVLRLQTLADMRQPHALQYGVEIWGLGTMLYAPNNGGGYVIGHDGNNEPAINTAARIDPSTGDGIIILETGNPLLATTLASEWVFWRTGSIDFLMFFFEMDRLVTLLIGGWVLIALVALVLLWLGFRRRAA